MKSNKLFTAIILFVFASFASASQSSLGDQQSSVVQRAVSSEQNKPLKASDFKKDERQNREFKDALISDIALPSDDGAAKPQSSTSSVPARIKKP